MAQGSSENLPATMPQDEFTAALIAAGFITPSMGGVEYHRIKVQGSNLVYNDEIIASYNAKTKEPALFIQLTKRPEELQSFFFAKPGEEGGELAQAVGRPEIAGHFCRSYFDNPDQARHHAEDGTPCDSCPVHPFMPYEKLPPEAKGKRCSWRGEIEFRIVDRNEDGTFAVNDDTIYTMSLPTTAMIEFKGSSSKKSNGLAGSVSAENTMVKLAKLGIEKWGKAGILKAGTMLDLGGCIFGLHIRPAKSNDGARSYNVVSLDPVAIRDVSENAALATSEGEAEEENLPF